MKKNPFHLLNLDYQLTDLVPMMSEQTMKYHYGKHYQTYVDNLNQLVDGSHYEGLSLEDIVRKAPEGPLANNAGQVLNHQLFFILEILSTSISPCNKRLNLSSLHNRESFLFGTPI